MKLDYIRYDEEESKAILGLNLFQFHESENLNNMLELFRISSDRSAKVVVEVADRWRLASSKGAELTYLGEEMGWPRRASQQDDEVYKLFLLLMAKYANSDITRDSLVEAVRIISGSENPDIYVGDWKTIEIVISTECYSSLEVLEELERFFPILSNLIFKIKEDQVAFGFEGDETALGFSSVYEDIGNSGALVSLVRRDNG